MLSIKEEASKIFTDYVKKNTLIRIRKYPKCKCQDEWFFLNHIWYFQVKKLFVRVCICECGCMCAMVWSEDNLGCGFLPSILFEVESLSVYCCVRQASYPRSFWGFSCLHLLIHHRSFGIIDTHCCGWLCIGSKYPNQVLMLAQQVLYPLSCLPSPNCQKFKVHV